MESLKLTIPSQQEGQHILVETNPAKLSQWIRSLPLADMSKTLPEVIRAISSLNRTELPYKVRSELVTNFDTAYTLIHDCFRPKISIRDRKNPEYLTNLSKLHTLTKEMAFAHKIIVNDSQSKRKLWGKDQFKTKASSFAIFYLGIMLIEQYELYAPIPIYLWREINSLYANAGKEEFNFMEIETGNTYCKPNVEQNYIRNCLLALSDPYHLDKGEHWYIFHYLHHWVQLANISENPDDFGVEECFIIDITSENKPNFVTSELDDPEDPKIRLLLTYDILRQIQFDLETLEEKQKLNVRSFHPSIKHNCAKYLWQHLQVHWRERIERDSRRYPVASKLDVVWGIHDIIRVMARISQDKNRVVSQAELVNLTQIKSSEHLTWDAINVSSGGIGICSRQYMLPHIELGNIVFIREYQDGRPVPYWRLAMCRWFTGDKTNGTMLGLEYINGKYTPVRLVLHQGQNERGGQPGIVISPNQNNENDAPTIITQEGSYNGNRVYAMLGLGEAVEVRPRVHVEATPCIDRFHYQTFELRAELAEEVLDDSEVIPWTAMPHEKGNIDDGFSLVESSTSDLNDITLPGDH